MGIKKKKQYQLLYLPVGKFVETFSVPEGESMRCQLKWHIITKSRTDLKRILDSIVKNEYSVSFYDRNEIPLPTPTNNSRIHQCQFAFIKVQPTESE